MREQRLTLRNCHNPISLLLRSLLFVGLVALTLFVVGPQAGSVDDDGDGSPDIPVVVSGPSLDGEVSFATRVSQRSPNISTVVASVCIGIPTPASELPSQASYTSTGLPSCTPPVLSVAKVHPPSLFLFEATLFLGAPDYSTRASGEPMPDRETFENYQPVSIRRDFRIVPSVRQQGSPVRSIGQNNSRNRGWRLGSTRFVGASSGYETLGGSTRAPPWPSNRGTPIPRTLRFAV